MARPKKEDEPLQQPSPENSVKISNAVYSYPRAEEEVSGELPALTGAEIIARQVQQTGFDIIRAIKESKK